MVNATLLILALLSHSVISSNILIIQPLFSGSHGIILRIFCDYLITRGHNVTVLKFQTVQEPKFDNSSVNVIEFPAKDGHRNCPNYFTPEGKWDVGISFADQIWNFDGGLCFMKWDMFCRFRVQCETLLQESLVQTLGSMNFDVAIVDLISNGCSVALAKALDLPVASFWVYGFTGFDSSVTPAQALPSIVPAYFAGLPEQMTFFERTYSFVNYWAAQTFHAGYNYVNQNVVSDKLPNLPPLWEMIHDVDLHFAAPNYLTTFPKLTPPNVFYIGGLHLREGRTLEEVIFLNR